VLAIAIKPYILNNCLGVENWKCSVDRLKELQVSILNFGENVG
jgi:hypothetical protein